MKVAVVGATGLVGRVMLQVLEEMHFPVSELIPVASERSVGQKVQYDGREFEVVSMDSAIDRHPDIALFSAGGKHKQDTCTAVCSSRNGGDRQFLGLAHGAQCSACGPRNQCQCDR